jgi:hypothetical protein
VLETRRTENFQRSTGFWRTGIDGRVTVPAGARYFVVKPGDGRGGLPVVHNDHGKAFNVKPAALGDFSLRIFGEQGK